MPTGSPSPTVDDSVISSDLNLALASFFKTFYQSDGYFYHNTSHDREADFWTEAMDWDTVMDAYQRTNSNGNKSTYYGMIEDIFNHMIQVNGSCGNWTSKYMHDDVSWWSVASLQANVITELGPESPSVLTRGKDSKYKDCAKTIFDNVYQDWDTNTGGIWWNTQYNQKNTVTNALAVSTAATLSSALNDGGYLDKAEAIYSWMKSNLTNGSGGVYDNIAANGFLSSAQLTYNYGTFIGAALDLYNATKNQSYLTDAINAADTSLTSVVTKDGLMQLETDTGDDGSATYKGIYVRNLAKLAYGYSPPNAQQYISMLQKNASEAWSNRNSDNLVGGQWMNPTPPASVANPIRCWEDQSVVAMLQATQIGYINLSMISIKPVMQQNQDGNSNTASSSTY
jgi:predicted alpha-1,6-mannanase (GH76 family)